ncbi:hypothetical protein J6590_040791 [Homalodisca vitripennis]|nr:hypothetical protein J6590_040791 [Homalodisca vitripennis]
MARLIDKLICFPRSVNADKGFDKNKEDTKSAPSALVAQTALVKHITSFLVHPFCAKKVTPGVDKPASYCRFNVSQWWQHSSNGLNSH